MSQNPDHVIIFDTTLRDGEQAPGFSMDVPSKLTMARAMAEATAQEMRADPRVFVYAAGGYYYPGKDDSALRAEMRSYLDRGYTVFAVVHGSQPKFQIPEMGFNVLPTMVMSSMVDRVPQKALSYLVYTTEIIDAQAADVLMSDLQRAGGITGWLDEGFALEKANTTSAESI